jgi:hypothetical protein
MNCRTSVVVRLATAPNGRGFKPGRGSGFLKDDKNSPQAFLLMGSKDGGPMSYDFTAR